MHKLSILEFLFPFWCARRRMKKALKGRADELGIHWKTLLRRHIGIDEGEI